MRNIPQRIPTTQQTPWEQQMIRSKQIMDHKIWMDRCTDMDFDYPYPMIRKREPVEDLSDELDFDDPDDEPDDEIKETYNKFLDNPMEIL